MEFNHCSNISIEQLCHLLTRLCAKYPEIKDDYIYMGIEEVIIRIPEDNDTEIKELAKRYEFMYEHGEVVITR